MAKPEQRQRQRRVLAPQYAFEFSCIGPECEDTCCRGWYVGVDEFTYKRYRRLKHPELRPIIDKAVRRNRRNPTPHNFAQIKMDETGHCPLLSTEGACRIHAELGEGYLANICAVYPRVTHTIDGTLERSLTMSCPEAARKALLRPGPMEFHLELESADIPVGPGSVIQTDDIRVGHKWERHLWDVRRFVIGLLQNREYTLNDRLVLLGLFTGRLDQIPAKERGAEVPALVDGFKAAVEDGSLRDSLAGIPAETTLQFKVAKELLDERFRQKISVRQYLISLKQALAGLRVTKEATVEEVGERYRLAIDEYYAPFMASRQHILENYVVNHVFKSLFPLGRRGPFGEYVMTVVHYALLKLHLIGVAAFHKELTEELVIQVIYSYARVIEHNPVYLNRIYDLLAESDLATMPYMAVLINN